MSRPASFGKLIGSERMALLRQAVLVPCDLADVIPAGCAGEDVVVLVHGFLASAGVFRPLRRRLETETKARVASFTHAPGAGVRRVATKLAEVVDRLPRSARVTIVGHSLGGIVARWYVQEMGGDARVAQTVSLASPFRGVDVPAVLVGADVHTDSPLLRRLREGARACSVPHTSIVAGDDTVVEGAGTACLGVGDVFVLAGRGHNEVLFDDEAARIVIRGLRRLPPHGTERTAAPSFAFL
jgi:pimeloyl-ACP methyl ester carboxylesterase